MNFLPVTNELFFHQWLMNSFIDINRLRHFNIISRSIVRSLPRMFFACVTAATIQLPSAIITLGEMFVAFRVGTVYHFSGGFSAIVAGRNYFGIYFVYLNRYPVIKYIALALEIFSLSFFTVFNYSAM